MPAADDFEVFELTHDNKTRRVFHTGSGPGVVILHEIPGLTDETFALGERIAQRGYTVFLPLLFGEAGQRPAMMRMLPRVCMSREFRCFAKHQSSPVTEWLRALCREVHVRCGGPGVGAIGMCITGGFVISMMIEPSLMAPVICQPSLPFPAVGARKAALGVSPSELEQAVERAEEEDLTLLGLRFSNDRICPPQRFETLRRKFGRQFEEIEIPSPDRAHGIGKRAHSVLVYHLRDRPGHPTYEALERVIALFDEQLRA